MSGEARASIATPPRVEGEGRGASATKIFGSVPREVLKRRTMRAPVDDADADEDAGYDARTVD